MHSWSFLKNALCYSGGGVHHVLAAVEDEQPPPISQEADEVGRRIARLHREAQGRRHSAGYEPRITDRTKIKESDSPVEIGDLCIADRDRNGRLSNSAGAKDRHEAPLRQQSG